MKKENVLELLPQSLRACIMAKYFLCEIMSAHEDDDGVFEVTIDKINIVSNRHANVEIINLNCVRHTDSMGWELVEV